MNGPGSRIASYFFGLGAPAQRRANWLTDFQSERTKASVLTAPALELPLDSDPVSYPIEILGPHQNDRAPRKSVPRISTGIVLVDSLGHIFAGRAPDIEGAVCISA